MDAPCVVTLVADCIAGIGKGCCVVLTEVVVPVPRTGVPIAALLDRLACAGSGTISVCPAPMMPLEAEGEDRAPGCEGAIPVALAEALIGALTAVDELVIGVVAEALPKEDMELPLVVAAILALPEAEGIELPEDMPALPPALEDMLEPPPVLPPDELCAQAGTVKTVANKAAVKIFLFIIGQSPFSDLTLHPSGRPTAEN